MDTDGVASTSQKLLVPPVVCVYLFCLVFSCTTPEARCHSVAPAEPHPAFPVMMRMDDEVAASREPCVIVTDP